MTSSAVSFAQTGVASPAAPINRAVAEPEIQRFIDAKGYGVVTQLLRCTQ